MAKGFAPSRSKVVNTSSLQIGLKWVSSGGACTASRVVEPKFWETRWANSAGVPLLVATSVPNLRVHCLNNFGTRRDTLCYISSILATGEHLASSAVPSTGRHLGSGVQPNGCLTNAHQWQAPQCSSTSYSRNFRVVKNRLVGPSWGHHKSDSWSSVEFYCSVKIVIMNAFRLGFPAKSEYSIEAELQFSFPPLFISKMEVLRANQEVNLPTRWI